MLDFKKQIQKVCNDSTKGLKPKQVIEDIVQLACNLITDDEFITQAFPTTLYSFGDVLRNELSHYKADLKAWDSLQALFMDYLQAISDSEPFTDIFVSMYAPFLGKHLGQYLTPPKVAFGLEKFLGSFQGPTAEQPFIIGDPCGCGSGALIMSQLNGIRTRHGDQALEHCDVIGWELDPKLVQMTTAQVVLSSCIHCLPVRSLSINHGHGIIDYEKFLTNPPNAFYWRPNTPMEEYVKNHRIFSLFPILSMHHEQVAVQ